MSHDLGDRLGDGEQRASTPSGPLGEDDGMQDLRSKMLEIQQLALSTAETALRMHNLMTRDYRLRHGIEEPVKEAAPSVRPQRSPSSPFIHVTEEDKLPSYCPQTREHEELDEILGEEQGSQPLGCRHYKRNVKVQCYDCQMWFPCRFCHDSSPDLPFHHQLNRKRTVNMLCMLCGTAQPASDICASCTTETAYYYCSKCKLWDNDSTKRIYHCDDCGICRRGEGIGKDYVHCKRCNVCISISTSSTHPCIERATDCDCPLCLEYLFSSSTPVVSLLCGHYMHATCYKDLMNVTYRCPVCSKSAVNMELQWRKLDDEIRMQPMPEEDFEEDQDRPDTPDSMDQSDTRLAGGLSNLSLFRQPDPPRRVPRKVWVGCNDCGGRGWTPFHWLGLKCPVCDGYNTNQMSPTGLRMPTSVVMPGTSRQRQHDFTGAAIMSSFEDPALPEVAAQPRTGAISFTRPLPRPATATGSMPSRSYFLSSSPSSSPLSPREWARRSWGSSLSPSRFAALGRAAVSSATSVAGGGEDDDEIQRVALEDPSSSAAATDAQTEAEAVAAEAKKDADYLSLAMARLERFGISPSDFLARMGISPSELLARLNISPGDFFERFGASPFEFLQRVGRSLSPMRHYLENLDANARDRAAKARENVNEFAASFMAEGKNMGRGMGMGMRWSRKDVAEGLERWEKAWRDYYASMASPGGGPAADDGPASPAAAADDHHHQPPRPPWRRTKSEADVDHADVAFLLGGDHAYDYDLAHSQARAHGFRATAAERAIADSSGDEEEESDSDSEASEFEPDDGGLDEEDVFALPGHR